MEKMDYQTIVKCRRFVFRFGLAFIGVGVLVFISSLINVYNAYTSTTWPKTQGEITLSEIIQSRSNTSNNTHYIYKPAISYTYHVAGQSYIGNQIKFSGTGDSGGNDARRYTAMFKAGQKTSVYYSPHNPEDSVLVPGTDLKATSAPFISLLFIIMGMLFIKSRAVMFPFPENTSTSHIGHDQIPPALDNPAASDTRSSTIIVYLTDHYMWFIPLITLFSIIFIIGFN